MKWIDIIKLFGQTQQNSEPIMTTWYYASPSPVRVAWLVQLQRSSDLQNSISIFTRDECVLCKYVQVFVQMSNDEKCSMIVITCVTNIRFCCSVYVSNLQIFPVVLKFWLSLKAY